MSRRLASGLAGAAALVAVATLLSRVVGFGRSFVFATTVGSNCLGSAYNTANQLPNVVFEVVAGGALASVVVPLLARPFADRDSAEAGRIASALLTWTLAVLVPVTAVALLLAEPLVSVLVGDAGGAASGTQCDRDEAVRTATGMLQVFLPQIPLYGVAVVCGGVLQAQRRFLAPAVAPLASSAVVVFAYLWFGEAYDGDPWDLSSVPRGPELILTVGTTAGVVALAAATVLPLLRSGIPVRPSFRFPPGVARQARGLALAGLAALVAQQASTLVVIRLANDRVGGGGLPLYGYAWAVFLLPYAVLAVPLATSAFPTLSRHAQSGQLSEYAAVSAVTTRAVLLAGGLGAALLAATAGPVSQVFSSGEDDAPAVWLARALVAFAPGLLGYGLVAHLGRALYAAGSGRAAATATVLGWALVLVADLALVALVDRGWAVAALGLGNTLGMTIAGVLLLAAVRTAAGPAALSGVARAGAAAVLAGTGGAVVGGGLAHLLDAAGRPAGAASAVASGAAAAAAYTAVVLLADRAGALQMTRGLRRG
ncbi:murein biosynthesis integral membrane protein MurJ [Motilibacter aurantiacus]|uniref:murein biosynthesis integral membrane protein MurJ n=1 Tax=Motilibacter aurantiacus TaxID=2714955 RepID=UPI0014081806|nr:oligosaccharide flippase family protein [Motilibacter aurantiacus]